MYAYAYGQLLALSVYARYEERGADFVPAYLELLRAGGSMTPAELGRIVGCDLDDPGFWDGGLDIVDRQLTAASTPRPPPVACDSATSDTGGSVPSARPSRPARQVRPLVELVRASMSSCADPVHPAAGNETTKLAPPR